MTGTGRAMAKTPDRAQRAPTSLPVELIMLISLLVYMAIQIDNHTA
jgi:hypothetical protein